MLNKVLRKYNLTEEDGKNIFTRVSFILNFHSYNPEEDIWSRYIRVATAMRGFYNPKTDKDFWKSSRLSPVEFVDLLVLLKERGELQELQLDNVKETVEQLEERVYDEMPVPFWWLDTSRVYLGEKNILMLEEYVTDLLLLAIKEVVVAREGFEPSTSGL